jgi:transposase
MYKTGVKYYHICEILKLTKERRLQGLSIKIVRQIENMVAENRRTCDIAKELNLDYNRVSHWVRKAKKEGVH